MTSSVSLLLSPFHTYQIYMKQCITTQASRAHRVDQQPAFLERFPPALRYRRRRRERRRRDRATRRRPPSQRDPADHSEDARQAAPPLQAEPIQGRLDAGSGHDLQAVRQGCQCQTRVLSPSRLEGNHHRQEILCC